MNEFDEELDRIMDDYGRDVLKSPEDWSAATRFRIDEVKQAVANHIIGDKDSIQEQGEEVWVIGRNQLRTEQRSKINLK